MIFNLKKAFEALLRFGESRDEEGDLPVSMVLLLREPKFLVLDQLRSAAERAFGTSFSADKESRHFVIQVALFTMMKAGPHTLSFLNYRKPYGQDTDNFGWSRSTVSQQKAWAEHTAWTAVDYVKGGVDPELEYAVLATLCVEMCDANCAGIYMPREQSLVPNDGSLRSELRKIAATRHISLT